MKMERIERIRVCGREKRSKSKYPSSVFDLKYVNS